MYHEDKFVGKFLIFIDHKVLLEDNSTDVYWKDCI